MFVKGGGGDDDGGVSDVMVVGGCGHPWVDHTSCVCSCHQDNSRTAKAKHDKYDETDDNEDDLSIMTTTTRNTTAI